MMLKTIPAIIMAIFIILVSLILAPLSLISGVLFKYDLLEKWKEFATRLPFTSVYL